MKRFLLAFFPLALIMSCTPASGPATVSHPLTIVATKTLSGIQVTASKAAKGLARDVSAITYGSTDANVVVVPVLPSDLSGKVAVVNSITGLVTPLGSTPTTITVTATDGVLSGSIVVTTGTIDLAGATGSTRWDATCVTPSELSSGITGMFMTFYGSVSEPEADHTSHGVTFMNQLNAGYVESPMTFGSTTPAKMTWTVIDGVLYLPEVHMKRADVSSPWVEDLNAMSAYTGLPNSDGNLGAYDDATLTSIEAFAGSALVAETYTAIGTTYSVAGNVLTMTMTNAIGFGGLKDSSNNLITQAVITFSVAN